MVEQRTNEWLSQASPEQIVAAQKAGELATVLGGQTVEQKAEAHRVATAKERMRAGAFGMTPAQIRATVKDSSELPGRRASIPEDVRVLLAQVEASSTEQVAAAEASGYLKPIQDLLDASA